jgi:phosphoadenosine phosphosulfate reductase
MDRSVGGLWHGACRSSLQRPYKGNQESNMQAFTKSPVQIEIRSPLQPVSERPDAKEARALALIELAAAEHGEGLVVSTSFGIHSAAMLHLATRIVPGIPVVWVDTGYLPPETYRFAEELSERLELDLRVASARLSPARMEALYGKLWETNEVSALDRYHQIRKIEPMQRALNEVGATAWLAGLRADQTRHRSSLSAVGEQWGRTKYLPLLDWSARDVHRYLVDHERPIHPLFFEGYASVGDWHTSRPLGADDQGARDTRFLGLKEECGLHVA